jgi:hypothetical protein
MVLKMVDTMKVLKIFYISVFITSFAKVSVIVCLTITPTSPLTPLVFLFFRTLVSCLEECRHSYGAPSWQW